MGLLISNPSVRLEGHITPLMIATKQKESLTIKALSMNEIK